MMASREWLVAWMAAGTMACVEPIEPWEPDPEPQTLARFSTDECTVVNPGPGVTDGLVGICHLPCDDGYPDGQPYEYVRVSPEACRQAHADHAFDFRSDDPLCRILPSVLAPSEPVTDTVLD